MSPLLEPDRLADAQTGAVEELDERAVAQVAGRRAGGGLDESLRLGGESVLGRVRARRGSVELRGGVVFARAEQLEVAEERAQRREPPCERRPGEAGGAPLGDIALELIGRRSRRAVWPRPTANASRSRRYASTVRGSAAGGEQR